MDRVEFEMRPSRKLFERAILKRLLGSLHFLLFWISINFIVAVLLVWFTRKSQNAIFPLGILLGTTLTLPFSLSHGLAVRAVRRLNENEEFIYYFDESGFGIRSDSCDSYMKWEGFGSVLETERFIFLIIKRGRCIYIFKELLDPLVVKRLKVLLNRAPILKKNLR